MMASNYDLVRRLRVMFDREYFLLFQLTALIVSIAKLRSSLDNVGCTQKAILVSYSVKELVKAA